MPAKLSPHAFATNALTNLYRIEALAYAIVTITDELNGFSKCEAIARSRAEEKSNTIYHLSGMLYEMAVQTQDFLLNTSCKNS